MFTRRILWSALAVAACAVPASATISYYADLPTFNAANPSATAVSFDGLGTGSSFLSTILNGVTFTGDGSVAGGNLTVLTNPGGSWLPGDVIARQDPTGFSNGNITIAFPANVFAFAFDTSYTLVNDNLSVTVTAGGDSFVQTPFPSPGPTTPFFLAARTTEAITSIVITNTKANSSFGYALQLGGFAFDTTSGGPTGPPDIGDAPEPASLFLIGTGLVAIPFLRRYRRRA